MILGRPNQPTPSEDAGADGGLAGRAGLVLLAISCLALSAAAPWVIRFLARGIAPIVPASVTLHALKSPFVLQPVFSGFSILSPSWLSVVMPIAFLAVALGAVALSRGRVLRVRRVPPWRSASSGVAGPDSYSAFGYAIALRHDLGNVLGASHAAEVAEPSGTPVANELGDGTHVEMSTSVVEPVATYLYRPARGLWLLIADGAKRLQSGRLDAYIAYMLVACSSCSLSWRRFTEGRTGGPWVRVEWIDTPQGRYGERTDIVRSAMDPAGALGSSMPGADGSFSSSYEMRRGT